MGLLAVASAKGSPGVTTTALVLGALWPRPVVLVECDPSGGDIALRLPSPDGSVLDRDRGLLSLVAAGRKELSPELVVQHSQQVLGGLDVVGGVRLPEQAPGLSQQWQRIGPLLAALPGRDVIADCGRIGATTPQNSVLVAASDILLVSDVTPSSVVHLRDRLLSLTAAFEGLASRRPVLHVAIVAPPKRAQAVRDVRAVLDRSEAQVESVHHLATDDRGAGFFAGRTEGRADRTHLVRSARGPTAELAERLLPFHQPGTAAAEEPAVGVDGGQQALPSAAATGGDRA